MENYDLSRAIENAQEERIPDKLAFPYQTLFALAGVNPNSALTVIPFLHKDRNYLHIPGRILRIHNLGGSLKGNTPANEEEVELYQKTLPEIPLIPMDVNTGIPKDFARRYGTADLFIVNHGIILSRLDQNDSQASNYLDSITNATHRGSILMVINDADGPKINPNQIADKIGAVPLNDSLDAVNLQRLQQIGLNKRRLARPHPDGNVHLGDFISLPESHNTSQIFFFRKT